MTVSRRAFLKNGGVAMIGMSTLPGFLRRAIAATPMPHRKKLVLLFQRGAAHRLNRALQVEAEPGASPFRAVAMGPNLPLTLRGSAPAIALPDVRQFRVFAPSPAVEGGFEALYAQTVDEALRGTGTETFEAIDMLRKADPSRFQPENGADYPRSRFGQSLQQIAQLIKADIGLEVAFLDSGGLGEHVKEGGGQGQPPNLPRGPGPGPAAFHPAPGGRLEKNVVVATAQITPTARG